MTLNCSCPISTQLMRSSIDSWKFAFNLKCRSFDLYMDEMRSCIALLQMNTPISRSAARCAEQRAKIALNQYEIMSKMENYIAHG